MYDNEDEIKRKRRNLIIIIAAIVLLIIILLIFLFVRSNSKKPTVNSTLQCELEVKSGTLGADDIYSTEVVVGFKSVTPISEEVKISKATVGTSNNSRNKETYTISKKGKIKVYGYVIDENGNTGTCELEVEVNPTKPTCELEVQEGTLGQNDWYTTDVVVGFKSMESNSETAKIEKYYIEKKTSELDSDEVIRAEEPTENIDKLTVTDNLATQLYGYITDTNGNEGTCSITVRKDSDIPTCKLKVVSGTQNSSGIYTTEVVVGMETATDATSDIASQGVGFKENYTEETVAVTATGTTVVYGYVMDNAGNKGTCSMSIARPTPVPVPVPVASSPSCSLKVVGSASGSSYIGATTVTFASKSSTNGASITSYGIGTSAQLNGQESYTINTSGTHTIYGMVKDSNGKTANCGPVTVNVTMATPLAQNAKVGDYVAYNAGNWESSAAVPTTNGAFGGYTSGASKNASVKCRTDDTATGSGWKVLSISGNTVTIMHAGIAECYYHSNTATASNAVTALNNRAKTTYMNSFATSARMYSYTDYTSNETFRNVGSHYYMATVKDSSTLYYVSATGRLSGGSARANGLRPVVVLNSAVTTTGKNTSGAWILILNGATSKDIELDLELPNSYILTIKEQIDEINKIIEQFTNSVLANINKEQ